MKNYVTFECTHIAEADKHNVDEQHAFAYADVDGYTANEEEEGTVICRVWLLKGVGNSPFLVDWHHNAYRMNETVIETIKEAKEKLMGCMVSQN